MIIGLTTVIIFLLIFFYFLFLNKNFHQMTFSIFIQKIIRKIFKTIFRKNPFSSPIGKDLPIF